MPPENSCTIVRGPRFRASTPARFVRNCLRSAGLLLLSITASAQTNLLLNPGFETGTTANWNDSYGTLAVVNAGQHSGSYCARVNYSSAVRQTVSGLLPDTAYTCSGWVKVTTAGQSIVLGAQNFGGTTVSQSSTSSAWTKLTLNFTTGLSATSATIFVYQSGANPGFCDDLSLTGVSTDPTGTSARRIADCLQRFGVNTFSKIVYNGYYWAWGGSQGNYDAATTGRAINYLTGTSGLKINIREYHREYGGGKPITPSQKTWIRAVHDATGSPFTISIGASGGSADIPGIVNLVQDSVSSGLNYVKWVEGINEPNMNFGYGTTTAATTASVQTSLFQQVRAVTSTVKVAGPSIAFTLPNPENSIANYLAAYKQTILDNCDCNNLHVYPPKSPNAYDGNSRGGALADIDTGYRQLLPGKSLLNTEWHPTLYSNIHRNDPAYDAYWGPIYILSSWLDFNWDANFWFALYDYNSVSMKCGLFATSDANPYPVANAIRALFQLTGDTGANKLSFTPGKLNLTVSGLPAAPSGSPSAGGRWALFQNSARTYFLLIWNEQNNISSATTPVTVTFNAKSMTQVEEFNITSGNQTALRSLTNVGSVTVNLDTSLRLLRITY